MLWLGESLQGFMHTAVRLGTFEAAHYQGEQSWPKSNRLCTTNILISAADVVNK